MGEKVVAKTKYLRTSPQKARLVVDLIRGKSAEEARRILKFSSKRVARMIAKTLESAISNAKQKGLAEDRLKVSKALVNQGPTFKRTRFASRGRIGRILKRTTHLTIELEEVGPSKDKKSRRILGSKEVK